MDSENEYIEIPDSDTTCAVCYAEFLDPEDLQVHIDQVHAPKLRCCQFCPSTFSDLETYVLHIRDNHITSIKCCKFCFRAFIDMESLRKHERKHYTNVKHFTSSCSQCKKLFSNVVDLKKHELNKHSEAKDGVMLDECYSLLSSVLNLKAESFLESLGSSAVYICSKCSMTTPDVKIYIEHLKKKNCRSLVCDKCSQICKVRSGLIQHMRNHPECGNYVTHEDMLKQCRSCNKYVDALTYNSHLRICKPYKCSCNTIFTSVHELADHQAKEHPLAISLTTCQFCRREFVGTVALKKHINRTHREDFHLYKYTCVYCENTYYKHPKDLFGHFFSKHQDIHPYSCKICNKSFRVRKRFTIHIKLDHKSVGFVEFDERYHVFFTDKKSEHPFQPTSLISEYQFDDDEQNESHNESKIEPQTDKETDAETSYKHELSETEKSHPKMRFKKQAKFDVKLVNINSDFMSATETEGNQTENDSKLLTRMKRKRKSKIKVAAPNKLKKKSQSDTENNIVEQDSDLSDDDDEPLVNVKKRFIKRKGTNIKRRGTRLPKGNKKNLTCKVCNKYCYTYQNYNHHVSLHFKTELKKCIKCSEEFLTKKDLSKHVQTKHSTSRLTETLKNLLERRKTGGSYSFPQLTTAEKFQRTIKSYKPYTMDAVATLTELSEKLSVQKFIESFTPDTNESKKTPIEIGTVVSVQTVTKPIRKPPAIKMTRFTPKPISTNIKLAMPVRFKQNITEKHKVTMKLVTHPVILKTYSCVEEQDINNDDNYQEETFADYEEMVEEKNESIPDVAQEVMLEGTEEPKQTVIPHKIVIPKIPQAYKKDIRIAHLLPEAPFFKIVKVNEVLKEPKQETPELPPEPHDLKLPSGTKLVNVNPLAHLLGDKPVERVFGTKYYKPKCNIENAIAKALLQLENPSTQPKKRSSKKNYKVEQ